MRLNVLITAASRRVAGPRLPAGAAPARPRRRGHRHRRQPGLAGRARRRPRLRGAVSDDPGLPRRRPRHLRAPPGRPGRADHRRRDAALRRGARALRRDRRRASPRRRSTPRCVHRQVRDVPAAGGGGRGRGDDVAAATSCPTSPPLPAVHQAARRPRQRAAFPARDAASWRSSSATSRPGRPGVPRRARSSRSTCSATSTAGRCRSCRASASSSAPGVIDRGRTVSDPRADRSWRWRARKCSGLPAR